MNFEQPLKLLLTELTKKNLLPAAQICVRQGGDCVFSGSFGCVSHPDGDISTNDLSLFDLASVTKLFVTVAFLRLVDQGAIRLDDRVCSVLPTFSGMRPMQPYEDPLNEGNWIDVRYGASGLVDAGLITFRQLLTHSSGLPAWRPFFNLPPAAEESDPLLSTFWGYPPSTNVVYSDLGLLLIGRALEKIARLRLADCVCQKVLAPLGLRETSYRPVSHTYPVPLPFPSEGIASTGFCPIRGKELIGEVNDENCWHFGGVTGHAGLFSVANELALFGEMLLNPNEFLSPFSSEGLRTIQAVSRDQLMARGIGTQCWIPDPAFSFARFSPQSFGHTGFTGTCLWVDPERDLIFSFLTNEVKHGRKNRRIAEIRRQVVELICQD